MSNKNRSISAVFASLILITMVLEASAASNVFFYEAKTTGSYKMMTDYSRFSDELKKNQYEVTQLQAGLTTESLSTYKVDVLVIPNLGSDLTDNELKAVFEFVSEEGKGVLLLGASPKVNKFTTPLGIMVVDDFLEDENSKIRDISGAVVPDKTSFLITPPTNKEDLAIAELTKGIGQLHFFKGNGLYLFGKSKAVIFGGDSTYSPKSLIFPKGSYPPVAAYVRIGNGTLFVLSDPAMLANKNIDPAKYRNYNLQFGVKIIDWLATPYEDTSSSTDQEVDDHIKALNLEKTELNRTLINAQNERNALSGQVATLNEEVASRDAQITELSKDKFMNLSYTIWAMLLLAAGFFLTAALMLKSRKAQKKGKGELGYEFKEASETPETDEFAEETNGIEGNVKEEDVEARLKELEKTKK